MNKKDINTMIGDVRFNFRVGAFITKGDKMLMFKSIEDNAWHLVGGRVKCNENTKEALIREIEEECNERFESDRFKLIHISELFFDYNEINVHEINFTYHIELNEGDELANKQDFGSCDSEGVIYHWFDKSEVVPERIKCLPYAVYNLVMRKNLDVIEWSTEKG